MPSKTSANKTHKCRGKYAQRGSQAFWEAKLKRMGLGLDAGTSRGANAAVQITYGHMVADLDWDGKVTYEPPQGERLDNGEWPISLM